jgi:hypothetical protein
MVTSMGISAGGGEAGFAKAVPDRALGQLRRTAFSQLFSAAQVERAQAEFDAEARLLAEHLLASSDSASLRSSLRRCVTVRSVAALMVLSAVATFRARPHATLRDASEGAPLRCPLEGERSLWGSAPPHTT